MPCAPSGRFRPHCRPQGPLCTACTIASTKKVLPAQPPLARCPWFTRCPLGFHPQPPGHLLKHTMSPPRFVLRPDVRHPATARAPSSVGLHSIRRSANLLPPSRCCARPGMPPASACAARARPPGWPTPCSRTLKTTSTGSTYDMERSREYITAERLRSAYLAASGPRGAGARTGWRALPGGGVLAGWRHLGLLLRRPALEHRAAPVLGASPYLGAMENNPTPKKGQVPAALPAPIKVGTPPRLPPPPPPPRKATVQPSQYPNAAS